MCVAAVTVATAATMLLLFSALWAFSTPWSSGRLIGPARLLEDVAENSSNNSLEVPEPRREFCFCVMMASTEEQRIMEEQAQRSSGIFQCDGLAIFSDVEVELGPYHFRSTEIGTVKSSVGQGGDATSSWVNTRVFMRAWKLVRDSAFYERFDWTVKVDPDTVLVVPVLRQHLQDRGFDGFVGRHSEMFLKNCPGVPDGFYGAVELMSRSAIRAFATNLDDCRQQLGHAGWGEDLFAQKCMEFAGVSAHEDFKLVADAFCGAPEPLPCADGRPAYHPLKTLDAWVGCWNVAQKETG